MRRMLFWDEVTSSQCRQKGQDCLRKCCKIAIEVHSTCQTTPAVANTPAATLKDKEAGMAEMSRKFREMGGEVYVDASAVKESNRAL